MCATIWADERRGLLGRGELARDVIVSTSLAFNANYYSVRKTDDAFAAGADPTVMNANLILTGRFFHPHLATFDGNNVLAFLAFDGDGSVFEKRILAVHLAALLDDDRIAAGLGHSNISRAGQPDDDKYY